MRTIPFLAFLFVGASGCAFTFDLTGGPRRETVTLPAKTFDRDLGERVSDSPGAMQALSAVRTRKRVGTVLTWAGLGSLLPCLAISGLSSQSSRVENYIAPIFISCGVAIAINLVSAFVNPLPGAWGDVLRAYNADFPATPYFSDAFGVPRPAQVDSPSFQLEPYASTRR